MVHVFWLHSHITYLVSKEIIRTVSDKEEVVVLLARGYQLPEAFVQKSIMVFSFPWYRVDFPSENNILNRVNILKTRVNVRSCKAEIEGLIENREFVLYVPTSWEYAIGMFIDHKRCKGYSFVEEGSLSYLENALRIKQNIVFKYIGRYIYNVPYYGMYAILPHFLGTYATSENAFPWNQKAKNVISLRQTENYFKELAWIDKILIFDPLLISLDRLEKFIDALCIYFGSQSISRFAYKFHPVSKGKPEKEALIREKLRKFEAYELPEEFVVELFLLSNPITVYTINRYSSLMLYAERFGSKVYLISQDSTDGTGVSVTDYNRSCMGISQSSQIKKVI